MPANPKPPGARRRRNVGQASWKTFAASPRSGKAPALPSRSPAWTATTRAWWRRVWRAPMAAAYLEADLGALFRLAELYELQARGELPGGGLPAIQALEDRFGMSPKSRHILQWQVLATGDAAPVEVRPSSAPAASVRRLRAVDPSTASASSA